MIAKQRNRRYLRGQTLQRSRCVGIPARRAARRDTRQIRGPVDHPVQRMGETRLALLLASGVDSRRQHGHGKALRLAERGEPDAALGLHGRIGTRERIHRRSSCLGKRLVGSRDPLLREPCARRGRCGDRRGKPAAARKNSRRHAPGLI
jgi:hypothetical protein